MVSACGGVGTMGSPSPEATADARTTLLADGPLARFSSATRPATDFCPVRAFLAISATSSFFCNARTKRRAYSPRMGSTRLSLSASTVASPSKTRRLVDRNSSVSFSGAPAHRGTQKTHDLETGWLAALVAGSSRCTAAGSACCRFEPPHGYNHPGRLPSTCSHSLRPSSGRGSRRDTTCAE
eukprot:2312462-Prymnesium_polylepis.1